jgi:hypothetical protein
MPVLISGRGPRRGGELSAYTPSESAPSDFEQRQAGWTRQDSFRSTYDGERTHYYATVTTEEDALQEDGEEERMRNMLLELNTLEGHEQEQFLRFSTFVADPPFHLCYSASNGTKYPMHATALGAI